MLLYITSDEDQSEVNYMFTLHIRNFYFCTVRDTYICLHADTRASSSISDSFAGNLSGDVVIAFCAYNIPSHSLHVESRGNLCILLCSWYQLS